MADLAEAVTRLAADPELRRRLALEGRKRVSEEFDNRLLGATLLRAYGQLLDPSSGRRERACE